MSMQTQTAKVAAPPRSTPVTVDARAFADLLDPYKQVINKWATLPVLTAVKLATAANQVFVVGTDLEKTLESRIATVEETPAELLVAVPFLQLLAAAKAAVPRSKKQTAELVLIHDRDANRLLVSSGASERSIPLANVEEFPASPTGLGSGGARKVDGPAFAAAALAAWRTTSDDQTRPILAGALLRVWDGTAPNPGTDPHLNTHGRVGWVSTDTYRLTIRSVPLRRGGRQPEFAAVLNQAAVKLAAGLFKGSPTVRLAADPGRVLLADDTRSLIVRVVEGRFPLFDEIIPGTDRDGNAQPDLLYHSGYGRLTVDRATLLGFLTGLPKTKQATHQPVRLTLRPDRVEASWGDSYGEGEATTTLNAVWDGPDGLVIAFNVAFLTDAYANLDGPVVLWVKDGDKPALALSDDTDGLYLLMPVRTS